jgi:hypothetical protein
MSKVRHDERTSARIKVASTPIQDALAVLHRTEFVAAQRPPCVIHKDVRLGRERMDVRSIFRLLLGDLGARLFTTAI